MQVTSSIGCDRNAVLSSETRPSVDWARVEFISTADSITEDDSLASPRLEAVSPLEEFAARLHLRARALFTGSVAHSLTGRRAERRKLMSIS